jgi:uncharacterized DUF497 family protein
MELFDWDAENIQHIALHNVSVEEAEHVVLNHPIELEYQDWHTAEDRLQEVGLTLAGRFLVVVTTERDERIRVVTAYDAPDYAIQEYFKNR